MISVKIRPKRETGKESSQNKKNTAKQNKTDHLKIQKLNISNQQTDTSLNSNYQKNHVYTPRKSANYSVIMESECQNHQLYQIERLSNEIKEECYETVSPRNEWTDRFSNIQKKFNLLFDLYIQEQIIKHYCSKTGWQFQKKLISTMVMPTLDLLAIRQENIKMMFQPFLEKITNKYLLMTELDTFSRMSSTSLLIQITQIWLLIKQAQIALKREIRSDLKFFRQYFCNSVTSKIEMDKQKLFKIVFKNSKSLKMVNVIKLYIFMFKVYGEENTKQFEEWLEQY